MSAIIRCSILKVEMGTKRYDIKETWSIQAAIAIAGSTFSSQRGFIKSSFCD